MIELLDDLELCLAGIACTIPQEFSVVNIQSSCDGDDIAKIMLKSDECSVELCTIKSIGKDDVRAKFLNMVEDKTRFILHGKVEERLAWYMYTIWAEYESSEAEYFAMHFGRVKGFEERLKLLVTSNGLPMKKILKKSYMDFFIKSFEILQYIP